MEAKCPQCKRLFVIRRIPARTMKVGLHDLVFCKWECKKEYRKERDEKVKNVVENILQQRKGN